MVGLEAGTQAKAQMGMPANLSGLAAAQAYWNHVPPSWGLSLAARRKSAREAWPQALPSSAGSEGPGWAPAPTKEATSQPSLASGGLSFPNRTAQKGPRHSPRHQHYLGPACCPSCP